MIHTFWEPYTTLDFQNDATVSETVHHTLEILACSLCKKLISLGCLSKSVTRH